LGHSQGSTLLYMTSLKVNKNCVILVWFGWEGSVTPVRSFVLSFCTGSVAAILTNPLDIVKVRMQV